MKKSVKIFLAIILVIAAAVSIFFYNKSHKVVYNNESATGNTAGNLNNGGLFCEYNGKIYFANPYDSNKLYSMNSDCTNAKKLNDDSVASLNVCGNYIYYVRNNFTSDKIGVVFRGQLFGVYRCDLNGKNSFTLYDKLSGIVSLYGNNIFYQHYDDKTAINLYKMGIDGKNNTKLYDTEYNPASIKDGKIYFSDITGKHNICTLDTKSNSVSTYYEANSYLADAEGNYLYYIDLSKNYSLVRLNMSTKTLELLYAPNDGKVINYNVYGNKIFFQVEGEYTGLYRMNIDGTQIEYIAKGNLTNIHCTSQYTFFQYFENQGVLYRVPTSAPITKVEEISIK